MKKNVPAFSVVEAVIGMVVSVIIIGLVFVVFNMISHQMMAFKQENQLTSDMNRFCYSINKDIFESPKLDFPQEEMEFISPVGNRARYLYNQDYLLRVSGSFTDTFHFPAKKWIVDTLTNSRTKAAYQRVTIPVTVNGQPEKLQFFRTLYAHELIKIEADDEH